MGVRYHNLANARECPSKASFNDQEKQYNAPTPLWGFAGHPLAFGHKVVWSHPAFANLSVYARNDQELVYVLLAAE